MAVRRKIEEGGRKGTGGWRRKKETGVVPLPRPQPRPSADVSGIMPTELHGWWQRVGREAWGEGGAVAALADRRGRKKGRKIEEN